MTEERSQAAAEEKTAPTPQRRAARFSLRRIVVLSLAGGVSVWLLFSALEYPSMRTIEYMFMYVDYDYLPHVQLQEIVPAGPTYDEVMVEFSRRRGYNRVFLYRATPRDWSNAFLLFDNLLHPRWRVPYRDGASPAHGVHPGLRPPPDPEAIRWSET